MNVVKLLPEHVGSNNDYSGCKTFDMSSTFCGLQYQQYNGFCNGTALVSLVGIKPSIQ